MISERMVAALPRLRDIYSIDYWHSQINYETLITLVKRVLSRSIEIWGGSY